MIKRIPFLVAMLTAIAQPSYSLEVPLPEIVAIAQEQCEQLHGASYFCTEVSQKGLTGVWALGPLSWVIIEGNSVIRNHPSTDSESMAIVEGDTGFVFATAIVTAPNDSHRWVEVEIVNGIDTYYGYVREDRIATSGIYYE